MPEISDSAHSAMRVLVVDDNEINRLVLQKFLRDFGPHIDEALNGEEALSALATARYDVVLMDVHMPVMDGLTATQRIRDSGASWACVPIIALTADAMGGDRERCLAAGMDAYVAKPVDRNELMIAMANAIAQSQSGESAA